MKKYEYRLTEVDAFDGTIVSILTYMGENGWELVSASTPFESPKEEGYWIVRMFFKREVNELSE